MPLTAAERQRVDQAERAAAADGSNKLVVRAPSNNQKLGPFTVVCTIINRAIGRFCPVDLS